MEIEKRNNGLISNGINEGLTLISNDNYEVSQDSRYLKINFMKKYDNNPLGFETNTWVQTNIIKDKVLNSKEINIKKIFITKRKNNAVQDIIIREIFIDQLQNEKLIEDKKITMVVASNQSIENLFQNLFDKKEVPALLLN